MRSKIRALVVRLLPKNLYSRLTLITTATIIAGYFVVYAAYQNFVSTEYESGAQLSSTFLGKIVSNLDEINGRVSNFGFSAGNVGIGTSSPVEKLHIDSGVLLVNGAGGSIIKGQISGIDKFALNLDSGIPVFYDKYDGVWHSGLALKNGNVGIGTASPNNKMDIKGNLEVGAGTRGMIINSTASDNFNITTFTNTPNPNFSIGYGNGAGGTDLTKEYITANAGHISFMNSNVGIGTTAPTEKLQVNGNILALNNAEMGAHPSYPGYSAWWVKGADYSMLGDGVSTYINAPQATGGVYFRVANATKMTIFPNGNATLVGTLTQASDARLKKEIIPVENPLEKISQLNGVTYYWKDPTKDSKRQIGVIAQDVEKVFPEAVATDEKGMKSVAYGNLVAPLIEAVKEQQKEIEELKSKIERLENR